LALIPARVLRLPHLVCLGDLRSNDLVTQNNVIRLCGDTVNKIGISENPAICVYRRQLRACVEPGPIVVGTEKSSEKHFPEGQNHATRSPGHTKRRIFHTKPRTFHTKLTSFRMKPRHFRMKLKLFRMKLKIIRTNSHRFRTKLLGSHTAPRPFHMKCGCIT
jgi:hypothetical protein